MFFQYPWVSPHPRRCQGVKLDHISQVEKPRLEVTQPAKLELQPGVLDSRLRPLCFILSVLGICIFSFLAPEDQNWYNLKLFASFLRLVKKKKIATSFYSSFFLITPVGQVETVILYPITQMRKLRSEVIGQVRIKAAT